MKETEELCLTVCGIERCTPDKSFDPTVRRDYHVHFILHGKGPLQIDGQTYAVQRSQLFCTPPGVEIYYYVDPTDPWFYTWISFSGARATYSLEKAGITTESPVRDCGIEPEEFLALKEYILNCRLPEASKLLRSTNRSIQEIAEAVGYTK